MLCFMLYLSSYLHSFTHARVSMSITFVEPTAAHKGADGGTAGRGEEAALSGGYTEAVEGWILQQLS